MLVVLYEQSPPRQRTHATDQYRSSSPCRLFISRGLLKVQYRTNRQVTPNRKHAGLAGTIHLRESAAIYDSHRESGLPEKFPAADVR